MKKACIVLPLCIMTAAGCGYPKVSKDEIRLMIRLDAEEDIGLLIVDTDVNGIQASGGISNADRTELKCDELLDWTINRADYDMKEESVSLSVRFRVITEYCDPNYENVYPEEYTVYLEPVSSDVIFGNEYHMTVTGSEENGYHVTMDDE